MTIFRILLLVLLATLFSPAFGKVGTVKKSGIKISGTLYYDIASYGGIQRDYSHLPLIPMAKYAMYILDLSAADSTPVVVTHFTTNKVGQFDVLLPSGKYGFATASEIQNGLKKGQSLPQKVETHEGNIISSSIWECNMPSPILLGAESIQNLVLTNHRSEFCLNCQ